ncbi:hypothetical protein BDQ12DRAFT_683738 [Crucibulum laeve]|uniref:Uncharacterized protein n=1 Tax=Crucibulum laeve TaxID=68775 RepID=A0A5C3M2A4_9AGAR|nr:hypothetical protein BDQ12DRAFT_683738 [Crucibulum laeve]
MPSKIPWESLKAETLRAICRDLANKALNLKRDQMIHFLENVAEQGLEVSLGNLEETQPPKRAPRPAAASATSESAHNTRFQGTKRVRVFNTRLGLLTRRKASKIAEERRKRTPRAKAPRDNLPSKPGRSREIFAGVVLSPRQRTFERRQKDILIKTEIGTDEDRDEESHGKNAEESSLADSNKENNSRIVEDPPAGVDAAKPDGEHGDDMEMEMRDV